MDTDDVCVITQPVSDASASHVEDLLAVLGTITTVSLLAVNVPQESSIRDEYEVIDIADTGTGSSIPVAAARFLRNQLRLARVVWQRDEGVILFFGAIAYLIPVLAAKLSGKTVVLEPRGDVPLTLRLRWQKRVPNRLAQFLAGAVWLLEQIGYRLADVIVTYTPSMAEELGLDRFESKLYSNGARFVDTKRFDTRTPFSERERTVGFIGRLDVEKRVPELAVAAQRLPNHIRFVFVGDGDYRESLEEKLSEEIKSGQVDVVGWVDHDEIPEQLNRLQLVVVPSHPTEGLPTVILESLACGTPVAATPVAGVPDIVRDGETGFLLSEYRPEPIAELIEDCLSRDDLGRISAMGRDLIESKYSFDAAVLRYRELLTSLSN